ncbi:MAG TPA: lytic murein transglycosylase [Solirubrobacteraceae bacterium]|nr:lytic murein transglycosylase [Solirubrobacteraceae bacterium]
MPPLISARRRALRTLLSVAGGGLTAAGLGGPLANDALAAGTPVSTESSTTPTAPPTEGAPEQQSTGATPPPTSTATTPPTATTPASSTVPQASTPASPPPVEAPTVVLQHKQKATPSPPPSPTATNTTDQAAKKNKAQGPNNVAPSPQSVAQAGALAAILASSQANAQALAFYRIPLFLLPIYKAAAVQYGVPWQILAAVNEIETNYGTDQAVSSAGAVGWMQFMPATWLQYGVDALDAGYADPYNPVDAIFAAARYLRAAGAQTDLHGAIFAYNHSEEYVSSVLLRAKLISTYPKAVIATLTGLIDGRLPVTGKKVAWSALPVGSLTPSSATANAGAVTGEAAGEGHETTGATQAAAAATPGSSPAVAPSAAAAAATRKPGSPASAQALGLVDLRSGPNASVVAVHDGRIVKLGISRVLGRYVVLRDVYGDLFMYAGLGSIAPTYSPAKTRRAHAKSRVVEAASTRDPVPSQPASAGTQSPLTLTVKAPAPKRTTAGAVSVSPDAQEESPLDGGKVRLFAHPSNPDARAAAAIAAAIRARDNVGQRLPLRRGSVVASGTVLGRVRVPKGAKDGHLRFSIRPAGDVAAIDPGPVLANWAQLQTALHPQGAKATNALLGATASDVFLLSKTQLERSVLADPGITISACGRHDIASGSVDRRVLAVLAFLSRSGLKPTVGGLSCGQSRYTPTGPSSTRELSEAVDITAINGTSIGGHQGAGTITDLTIRTLMTLPSRFVPHQIISLMHYPGQAITHANPHYWEKIHLAFAPVPAAAAKARTPATVAHSAQSGRTAPVPVVTTSVLDPVQWNQLMTRVAGLQMPVVASKPSDQAIPSTKPKKSS